MQISKPPHRWNVSPVRAAALQRELAPSIIARGNVPGARYVAGADLAFTPDQQRCIAGVVVWDLHRQEVVEQRTAVRKVNFPYVPGLLSFREAPALLAAIGKLAIEPDAYIFDGQGYAHPRRFGLACHVGLLIDRPSAGCAKSRLIGHHAEPGRRRGSMTPLIDKGRPIGTVLRTRDKVKPVYVSLGHRLSLSAAEKLVLACCAGYRLPEPTRLADHLVAMAKRRL
ncbi:MAG: deoxyribonuclease V [Phycisphaerae bacterium]